PVEEADPDEQKEVVPVPGGVEDIAGEDDEDLSRRGRKEPVQRHCAEQEDDVDIACEDHWITGLMRGATIRVKCTMPWLLRWLKSKYSESVNSSHGTRT